MTDKTAIMVVVHAGSACGSANMNLGYQLASSCRDYLAQDLDAWNGPILVIDGSLSDELADYPKLDAAIKAALKRGRKHHKLGSRIWGCDDVAPHQTEAVTRWTKRRRLKPANCHFEVTGCWTSRLTGSGCVDDVVRALVKLGFTADIRDSAIDEPSEDDDE